MRTHNLLSVTAASAIALTGLVAAPVITAAPAQAKPVCYEGNPTSNEIISKASKKRIFVTNSKAPQISLPEGTKFSLRTKASFSLNGNFKASAGAGLGVVVKKVGLNGKVNTSASVATKVYVAAGISLSGKMPTNLPGRQVRAKFGTSAYRISYTVKSINLNTCKVMRTTNRSAVVFPKHINLEMRYFKD